MRLRLTALVLLVIATTAAASVLARVDSSRDASDGYWKRVNPTVEALLGYTEREALGRPFIEFVHPDDRERSGEEARRVLEGTTIRAFENRRLCKDGSHKWIEWTVTPLPEARVMYGVGRDSGRG